MSDRTWLVIHGVAPSLWAARILKKRQTIGRSSDCDVRLVHNTVSRRHAEIWRDGNTLFVRDLESRNGTFVDQTRITESAFKVGNTIQIGLVPLNVVNSIDENSCNTEEETKLLTKSPGIWQSLSEKLSPGQIQVMMLLLRGMGEKEAAEHLCLSRHTIHTHVKHIYKVLEVQSRSQLLAKYLPQRE